MNEQLQEIINDLPYSIRHEGSIENLIKYAGGQAKRVEEVVQMYSEVSRDHTEEIKCNINLQKQNKRYREAIEKACREVMVPNITRVKIYRELHEALESESE